MERSRFHHRQLLSALSGDRYRSLLADLHDLADDPPVVSAKVGRTAAAPVVERLAGKQWARAQRFSSSLGPDVTDVDLHDVRKRIKRARYAVQSAKRLGIGSKAFRRELADLQDRLGDHHDLVVQRTFLVSVVDRLGPNAAFLAGRLLQDADIQRLAMVEEWPDLADRIERLAPN